MRLVTFVVAMFVLVVTGDARAGNVDWSAYIDDGAKLPPQKTPTIAVTQDADEDTAPAAKAAPAKKGKRGARAAKAKTSKAKKVKSRAKAKSKKRR
jgi:hypothetical protein